MVDCAVPIECDIEDANRLEYLREVRPFLGIVAHMLMKSMDDRFRATDIDSSMCFMSSIWPLVCDGLFQTSAGNFSGVGRIHTFDHIDSSGVRPSAIGVCKRTTEYSIEIRPVA
jgi:hypothetical protein